MSKGLLYLPLNILVLPGLGTVIGGKQNNGIWQLSLFIGGLIVGSALSFLIVPMVLYLAMPAAWICSSKWVPFFIRFNTLSDPLSSPT